MNGSVYNLYIPLLHLKKNHIFITVMQRNIY